MIPVDDDQTQVNFPWATVSTIGLCILVFIWQHALSRYSPKAIEIGYGLIPARFGGGLVMPEGVPHVPKLLTPLTSALIHGGIAHLLGNMLFLWVFGKRMEDSFGSGVFVAFAVVTAYASAIAEIIAHWHQEIVVLGASGFVSGIMGAFLAVFPFARIRIAFFTMATAQGGFTARVPAWILLGVWVLTQLRSATTGQEAIAHIGFIAHLGGFVVGAILARVILWLGLAVYDEGMAED